jgi:4-amino-4-deoxy-L-arabinose transferase-like glycosyltransferase
LARIENLWRDAPLTGPQKWGLCLAVVTGLALRLLWLFFNFTSYYEIYTWQSASPGAPLTWSDLVSNYHGPLVSALLHGWLRLAGDSETAIRLPFALAGAVSILALAHLARAAAGTRAVLPMAWLAALSPFLVWYGQEARNYSFAILFAAMALAAALRYRATGRNGALTALALASVLGALSNLNGLLLLPALLVPLAFSPPPGRSRLTAPLVVAAAVAVALSPWILQHFGLLELQRLVPGREALPTETPLRGATTFTPAALPYTLYVFSTGYTLGPSLRELHEDPTTRALLPHLPVIAATFVVFGALALSGIGRLARRPFVLVTVLAGLIVPVGFVAYFAIMNFKTFNPRYAAVGLPAWLTLVTVGWVALPRAGRWITGLAVGALFALSLAHHYSDPAHAKDDFRAASAHVRSRIGSEDRLVVAGNHPPLDYYWRDGGPAVVNYWLGYVQDERMAPRFESLMSQRGATWVFVSRAQDLDPGGRFERWLVERYRPATDSFPGVRVYRIEPAR